MNTLGVDIGGTKIGVGVVTPDGELLDRLTFPTDPDDPAAIDATIAAAYRALADYGIGAVGLAAAGFIGADRATVRYGTNLAWRDYPLRDKVAALLDADLPVVVENDANAAGWAEYRFGVGKGVANLVLLTVGTGLGGAVIVDGRLLRGGWGSAGELGHMRVVPDGIRCPCGQRGCLEQYTSGRALAREARAAAKRDPQAAATLLEFAGGPGERIKGPHVTAAAQAGDPFAIGLIEAVGRWIGTGAASIAAILDPEMFVIGGGVSAAGDLLLDPIREAFAEHVPAASNRVMPAFEAASMGNLAGIVGAGDLARI